MKGRQLYLQGIYKAKNKDIDTRRKISIPLDVGVLLIVVGVIVLTLSFSLGVEKGKQIAYLDIASGQGDIDTPKQEPKKAEDNLSQDLAAEEEISGAPQETVIQESEKSEKETVASVTETTDGVEYKIQVASFYKENTANKEARRLKDMGYPASVEKKGKYAVVYVGNFDNKKKAKEHLQSLRKTYKDCILRRL